MTFTRVIAIDKTLTKINVKVTVEFQIRKQNSNQMLPIPFPLQGLNFENQF